MTDSLPDNLINELAPVFSRFGMSGEPAACLPLAGGRSNRIWLLRGAFRGADVVLKLFPTHSENPLFPNDGAAELRVLKHLKEAGLAPIPIGGGETGLGYCLIYVHVAGAVAAFRPTEVGQFLARLHGMRAPSGMRQVTGGTDGVLQSARMVAARLAKDTMPPLPDVPLIAPPKEGCLLHGDLVPSNIVSVPDGLVAIDWQCPARGDPCEDIAVFLSPAMQVLYGGAPLTERDKSDFFQAYGAPEVEARYRVLEPLYHWRMAAYCAWKADRGERDYGEAMGLELAALQRSANP